MTITSRFTFTPDNITGLKDHEVFVFGSNLAGIHGKGAALTAKRYFKAQPGVPIGRTGQCYAIPTKSLKIRTLPLEYIEEYITSFINYATHHEKDKVFLVTKVGCGYAGYKIADIAPMFTDAIGMPNVILPMEFYQYIIDNHLVDGFNDLDQLIKDTQNL